MCDQQESSPNKEVWQQIAYLCLRICVSTRKQMIAFARKKRKRKKSIIAMDFVRRVECNLFAIMSIAATSLKAYQNSVYLKHPMGLLLRSCFIDCITGLYVTQLKSVEITDLLNGWSKDYAKSMIERYEVYIDKLGPLANQFDDCFLQNMYTLSVEDNFMEFLALQEPVTSKALAIDEIWQVPGKTFVLKTAISVLINDKKMTKIAKKLNAYYKYFSQYEHFSEYSWGDALVDFGNDNVSFVKALELVESVVSMIEKRYCL